LKIENFAFQIGRAGLPGNLPIFNSHFSIFNSFPLVAATRPRYILCGEKSGLNLLFPNAAPKAKGKKAQAGSALSVSVPEEVAGDQLAAHWGNS